MCGFLAYFGSNIPKEDIIFNGNKIRYRGPDNSSYKRVDDISFLFHRLSIIDTSSLGNQPMSIEDDEITLVCNGEIYNYKDLISKFNFNPKSNSDCEVIMHLYKSFGLEKTLRLLDGVFAFVLYDKRAKIAYAARDPFGVRPSFFGVTSDSEEYFIASEAKAISELCEIVYPFPPGSWWGSDAPNVFTSYYNFKYKINDNLSEEKALLSIRRSLVKAVEKRLMSEREIGCLLSGGLDSSLITALVSRMLNGYRLVNDEWVFSEKFKINSSVKTFSIGMEGSPDLKYAKKVAKFIGSDHNEVKLTELDFLRAIEEVVYKIESFDTTTVRASVGNYLVSKFIKDNTDCKVIFNGDGSDEACCGYVYNINAPDSCSLHEESARLLSELYLFDVLRSDRSISSNGLEARTPFLDKEFVKTYMSIPPSLKSFDKKTRIEKHLLRKAFACDNLLPEDVLWRHKCAFSDGVSSIKTSWHKSLQEFVDTMISDEEFEEESSKISHCKPLLKESFYYRKVFDKFFAGHANLISHFWMPKWTDVIDPSARELNSYKE